MIVAFKVVAFEVVSATLPGQSARELNRHASRKIQAFLKIVCNHYNGPSTVAQFAEHAAKYARRRRIEPRIRFVEQNHLGIVQ